VDAWNSLGKELQDIMIKTHNGRYLDYKIKAVQDYKEEHYKAAWAAGMEKVTLTPEESNRWVTATLPAWKVWIDANGPEAQQIWEIIKKWKGW
ncbi:MAG: hypothetical protein PHU23_19420, partial [Dehalococcoidales bacterium]|nr:hypothetical protein [Dehalococcoidales bacterium]